MTDLTLGQAARLCRRGKTTLTRAIRSGRLSATRREDGGYLINVAELERVFPLEAVAATGGATDDVAHHATVATAALEAQIAGLREVGNLLRRQLDDRDRQLTDLKFERDRWFEAYAAVQRQLPTPAASPVEPTGNGLARAWRWMRARH